MDDSDERSPTAARRTTSQSFKVVLLGEGCVGKTSLVLRYTEDKFNDKHVSTLQVWRRSITTNEIMNIVYYDRYSGFLYFLQASFVKKKLNLNGRRINLAIWDTAGQERFHALGPIYYRMSNGAILVYDITDEDSFQKVIFYHSPKHQYLIFMVLSNIISMSIKVLMIMSDIKIFQYYLNIYT